MNINLKIDKKQLALNIAVPLGLGIISSLLTMSGMKEFALLSQPALTPPPWVFAVAWTILYILMGISSYLIYTSNNKNKEKSLKIYTVQLIFNTLWTFIFFNKKLYLLSFIWILILIILVLKIYYFSYI